MREKLSNFLYNKEKKRTKKYRKKVKRELKFKRNRNKKLIQKYPWLRVPNLKAFFDNKIPFLSDPFYINVWEDLPEGWLRTFGKMMCDEIEAELEKYHLEKKTYVEQAKEKYGQLRIYMAAPHEVLEIIDIYSAISEHVCCRCGRPHSPMMNFSWISPYCKNCFEKIQRRNEYFYKGEYEKYAPEDKEKWKIPTELKWTRFSKDGETIKTVDISDRVTKIERLWNKRHPDDEV